MDGQQRLNAVYEYIENNFGLIGLGHLHFLNGRRYNSLPPKLKRGLDRASISAVVLLRETRSSEDDPFMVRKYVFERLNTGGEKLNAQELRNNIFRGSLNDLIVSLARNPVFCDIFGIPKYTETDESEFYENPERQRNTLYRAMGDCQIVLRFLAFRDEANIRGAVQDILDRYMRANLNPSEGELRQLRELFESTIGTCHAIFGENVFRLPPDEQGRRRLSIPLYDATMVAAASHISDAPRLLEKREEIRADMDALVAADIDLFTARGNTAQSIRDRILAVDRLFSSKCIE